MNADNRDPIAAAQSLEQAMTELAADVRLLSDYGHRNRALIWGLAVSLLLDLILTVVVIFVALAANSASREAAEATSVSAQNRQNALVTCQSSNEARRVSRQLWNYVLDLSVKDKPNMTPEQRQRVETFREYLSTAYADRDCSNPTAPTPIPPTPTR